MIRRINIDTGETESVSGANANETRTLTVTLYHAEPNTKEDLIRQAVICIDKPNIKGAINDGYSARAGGRCVKCGYGSGVDWMQCHGKCPIPGSPHYDFMLNWRALYAEEGKKLADALCGSLPGGTIDALLVELLDRRRSLLAIRHEPIP